MYYDSSHISVVKVEGSGRERASMRANDDVSVWWRQKSEVQKQSSEMCDVQKYCKQLLRTQIDFRVLIKILFAGKGTTQIYTLLNMYK